MKSGYCATVLPNLFGIRDQFHGRQFFHRWGEGGSRGNVSNGDQQTKLHLLATHLLLCGLVPNRPQTNTGPGVGDPCCTIMWNPRNHGEAK